MSAKKKVAMREKIEDVLETLIDQHGISEVLHCLANVCYKKSNHLSANWQDPEQAKEWAEKGHSLNRVEL